MVYGQESHGGYSSVAERRSVDPDVVGSTPTSRPTPLVKKLQERYGSRRQYERMEEDGDPQDTLTAFEEQFLADRDSSRARPDSRYSAG
jgi:hypothetical protein